MNKKKIFLVVDIETTGLHFNEGVTEITAKAIVEGNEDINVVMNQLTDPEKPISAEITKITQITDDMVAGQISYRKAFYYLSDWIDNMSKMFEVCLVAHNTEFEKKFFAWNLSQRSNMSLSFIDTRANHLKIKDGDMSGKWVKNYSTLEKAANHYGFEYDKSKAHRAEYDVDLCIDVFKKQLESLNPDEMKQAFKEFQGDK